MVVILLRLLPLSLSLSMGRAPCCEKVGLKRGRWTKEEDGILAKYIKEHGEGSWRSLPKNAGMVLERERKYSRKARDFSLESRSIDLLQSITFVNLNRVAEMWEELQAEMDKLPESRSEAG